MRIKVLLNKFRQTFCHAEIYIYIGGANDNIKKGGERMRKKEKSPKTIQFFYFSKP